MKSEYKHNPKQEPVNERERSSSMKRGEYLYEKAMAKNENR